MTDITFVTSNKTKLAHARYLCRNYQVDIKYYKKMYYGYAYKEPRTDDRRQLLTESFESAVARWKKYVTERDNRLFFIEDTSVRIDALSDETNEVPGVDVKYWMRETSFEKLDKMLKARGNNRKCSVTSHVLLFLTDELKNMLGIEENYKVFTSTANGTITENEYVFDTNILYPWLDNNSFNKWFVPNGCDKPVSMLDIIQADAGDFRKGAFEKMLSFLEANGAIKNRLQVGNQLRIQFYDSFVICGKTCAGKSTIGRYLADEYGYYHIEASEFMTQKLLDTHGSASNVDKHEFAAKMLQAEPLFVVKKLVDYLHDHEINDKFVITGFRTEEEVGAFFKTFTANKLYLIYVKSDYEERFRRWKLRQRDCEQYSEERFKEIDTIQEEMGVGSIENMKGVMTLDNSVDGLSHYFRAFRKQFLHEAERDVIKINVNAIRSISISLEKAILVTLAIECQKDESRYYTTTEISHLINHYFKEYKKNKNNVSRYFNQSVYVYYEVRYENRKNKYRISPIGYSEALKVYRDLKRGLD